jgi:hypothetical protein
MQQYRVRFMQIPRWQLVLAAILLLALFGTLFVVAISVFVVVFPVFVIGAAILAGLAYLSSLFGGRRPRGRGDIIETEYRVLDQRERERDRD